jgi:(p)ppGpp synthase/HD superfamily hydrolase
MNDLTTAIRLAAEAHDGKIDKGGDPYILHPLRVMLAQEDNQTRIAAVLHDVAEDWEDGWRRIREAGFDRQIVEAIDALTHRKGEDYFAYVDRAGANTLARAVKLADISDNLSPGRLTDAPQERIERYLKARSLLMATDAAASTSEQGPIQTKGP